MVISCALLSAFFFAYYGKERQYYFTEKEVTAAQFLYSNAPEGSLIIEGSRNYPSQFKNYEFFTYVPIAREPMESRLRLVEHPVEVLYRWMSNTRYPAAYLIVTRSQKAESEMLGVMPSGSLDRVEQMLRESPAFKVVYANEDASIFSLADRGQVEIP